MLIIINTLKNTWDVVSIIGNHCSDQNWYTNKYCTKSNRIVWLSGVKNETQHGLKLSHTTIEHCSKLAVYNINTTQTCQKISKRLTATVNSNS